MKTKFTIILIALFMSFGTLANETTVYGSGGMVVQGSKITYCPNRDRIVCAKVTTKQESQLAVGSVVQVTPTKSNEKYLLKVVAITGPFDKEGNIQGADIQFEKVKP